MAQKKQVLSYIKSLLSLSLLSIALFCVAIFSSSKLFADELASTSKPFIPLTDYIAQYQLKSSKYKLSATALRKLSISQDNVATLEQNASIFVAKINQKSSFFINKENCEIVANSYDLHQSALGNKKDYRIAFDYEKKQFIENNNEKEKISTIQGKLYDELSYQEALRCELKNKPDIKIGHEFSYIVRTKGKNKEYTFIVSALEKLNTQIGIVDSVKLSRVRAKENEKNGSFIWFSKQHDYLLVKFKQQEDDDTYGLDIKSVGINK